MDTKEFCEVCGREVPEGSEHDWLAHGSTEEHARELMEWKEKLRKSSEHH